MDKKEKIEEIGTETAEMKDKSEINEKASVENVKKTAGKKSEKTKKTDGSKAAPKKTSSKKASAGTKKTTGKAAPKKGKAKAEAEKIVPEVKENEKNEVLLTADEKTQNETKTVFESGKEETADSAVGEVPTGTQDAEPTIKEAENSDLKSAEETVGPMSETAKDEKKVRKILFVGAEAMPFAATGGLGDVLGSLPASIKAQGGDSVDVRVVMPLYSSISNEWRAQMKQECEGRVNLAWRNLYCGIFSLQKDGVTYYFIDNEYYFKRDSLYGNYDDGERFAYFCIAALELIEFVGFYPDVLHAHDWQAALAVIYLNCKYRWRRGYENIRTVFTIHNIEYQGKYDFAILGDVFALGEESRSLVEYGDCINLMKGAIQLADKVSTVSPKYAQEIRDPYYAHGLEHILNRNAYKLCGILNGIDYDYYNPQKDKDIACAFSSDDTDKKTENKFALQNELGLPKRDVPMIAIISRLAAHKGLDLVCDMIYNLISGEDVQLVILGKGEERFESFFRDLEYRFSDKVRALITYDRALSKRIYAAADVFLMPSKSEPCGLSQMIASRYGAIPVTRETGGLYDSIKGYWENGNGELMGNGFTFANYSSRELLDRTYAAIGLCRDGDKHKRFVQKIMNVDFSWGASAKKYLEMYDSLI